jgi:hypothetical protein
MAREICQDLGSEQEVTGSHTCPLPSSDESRASDGGFGRFRCNLSPSRSKSSIGPRRRLVLSNVPATERTFAIATSAARYSGVPCVCSIPHRLSVDHLYASMRDDELRQKAVVQAIPRSDEPRMRPNVNVTSLSQPQLQHDSALAGRARMPIDFRAFDPF